MPQKKKNTVRYRIIGILLSTVEQQDTIRKVKVKKLREKFESHQHKESFFGPDAEDQHVYRRIEGFDRRHEQHRDLLVEEI